jgi:hypothetical protein
MVIAALREFPAPSVATTVTTLDPSESVTLRLQLAVLLPLDVPPLTVEPFTMMLLMPLPPVPASLAVPLTVIVLVVTV